MDQNKICFITCVNNEQMYQQKCLKYLQSLFVPDGIQISYLPIKNAPSMTKGYNAAMRSTDAKYKVYLHQDAYIVDQNFISEVLSLFKRYPKIGMMGILGAKTIPSNGIWWYSDLIFGKLYNNFTGEIEYSKNQEPNGDFESVKLIDGVLMITQYDRPWREDLFKGWHFYDTSQSLEFIKAGYEVVVPKLNSPWCLHDIGKVNYNGFEKNRKIFLKNYPIQEF